MDAPMPPETGCRQAALDSGFQHHCVGAGSLHQPPGFILEKVNFGKNY